MVCLPDYGHITFGRVPDRFVVNENQAQAAVAFTDHRPLLDQLTLEGLCLHWDFGTYGVANGFLEVIGIGSQQILFTDFSFIFVSVYIFIPFMILPIFNALDELNPTLLDAANDLGASRWMTFRRVIFPLTLDGVKTGCQVVFIPALSLFMLTRLIAGNRVITLGTAIEQHFLVTQDWGMGSTIAVFLIIIMFLIMFVTGNRKQGV